jgi:5-methylcytosine-specific restriction endonuclease McrA
MPAFNSVKKNCLHCGKEIWSQPNQLRNGRGKFCSRSCSSKTNMPLIKHPPCSEATKAKLRLANIGKTHPENSGPNHHWYKHGKGLTNDTERKQIMATPQYRVWRFKVFERDNWKCVMCGHHGKDLQADHLYSFTEFEELRFDLRNGRTLCKPCHQKTENYGWNKKHYDSYYLATIIKLYLNVSTVCA